MNGGAPRAVWLTTQTDPGNISARSAAQYLAERGEPAHLVWNPVNGQLTQLLPVTRAARGLDSGHDGRVCVVVRVVGFAETPFTDGPATGLDAIVAWLETWGVPRTWPAGPPADNPVPASRRVWSRGGHFGGAQVPRRAGPGPGAIDTGRVIGPVSPACRQHDGLRVGPAVTLRESSADGQDARLPENDGPLTHEPLVTASATPG